MLALITTAHHTCYPNPIAFRAGERVRIGYEDDEFPGWVRTFTADGNEGWAPLSLLTPISAGGAGTGGSGAGRLALGSQRSGAIRLDPGKLHRLALIRWQRLGEGVERREKPGQRRTCGRVNCKE